MMTWTSGTHVPSSLLQILGRWFAVGPVVEPSRNARGEKPFARQALSRESKMRKLVIMTLLFTLAVSPRTMRGAAACTAMEPAA
jgi:hypothetical protein